MLKHIQFVLVIIFLMLFSVVLLIIPVGYIFWNGKSFIEEIQKETRNRALEVGVALNTLSGESFYYDNMISLSNVLHKILEDLNTRNDPYQIKEIFLVDKNDKLIAHSDIIKVAKDHQEKYDPIKYKFNDILFILNPITIDVIGYADLQIPDIYGLKNKLQEFITKNYKNLLANQFHVYTNVYPPDSELPAGSLHILIENKGITTLVNKWFQDMLKILIFSTMLLIIFLILSIVYLYFLIYHQKKQPLILEEIKELDDPNTLIEEQKNKISQLPEDELQVEESDIEELKKIEIEPDQEEKIVNNDNNKVIDISSVREQKEKQRKNIKTLENQSETILDAIPLD